VPESQKLKKNVRLASLASDPLDIVLILKLWAKWVNRSDVDALGVLDDNALYKSTYLLTYLQVRYARRTTTVPLWRRTGLRGSAVRMCAVVVREFGASATATTNDCPSASAPNDQPSDRIWRHRRPLPVSSRPRRFFHRTAI